MHSIHILWALPSTCYLHWLSNLISIKKKSMSNLFFFLSDMAFSSLADSFVSNLNLLNFLYNNDVPDILKLLNYRCIFSYEIQTALRNNGRKKQNKWNGCSLKCIKQVTEIKTNEKVFENTLWVRTRNIWSNETFSNVHN